MSSFYPAILPVVDWATEEADARDTARQSRGRFEPVVHPQCPCVYCGTNHNPLLTNCN